MRRVLYIIFFILIVLVAVLFMGLSQQGGISPPSTNTQVSTTPTSPISSNKLSIYDVIPQGFHVVDEVVYWKLKIFANIDLRDKVEINGTYGYWTGIITIVLPNGREPWIFIPPDYSTGRNQFNYITGSVEYDVPVYDLLGGTAPYVHPQSPLNGTYKVIIWLSGPYDEKIGEYPRVILIEKTFNYTFKASIDLHPLEWSSWDQDVVITISNEGDIPIFFKGAGILIHGVNTVIGWLTIQNDYVYIDINESKNIDAKLWILEDYKAMYEGKVEQVDILFDFQTIQSPINITFTIKFPTK